MSRPPPGAVLSAALAAMTVAGTVYWAPSLSSSLGAALRLSAADRGLLVAAFSASYIFDVLPGLLQGRLGPRRAAALGSVALAASYAALAALASRPTSRPLLVAAPLAVTISMASYAVYAAAASSASAAYPIAARGRVTSLLSAIYAMSAGLFAAFQAAFFPTASSSPTEAVRLLVFVAVLCAITGFASIVYPSSLSKSPPTDPSLSEVSLPKPSLSDSPLSDSSQSNPSASDLPVLDPSFLMSSHFKLSLFKSPLFESSLFKSSLFKSSLFKSSLFKPSPTLLRETASPESQPLVGSGSPVSAVPAAPVAAAIDQRSITAGYAGTAAIALLLQLCALAEWAGGYVRVGGMRVQLLLVCVLLAVLPVLALPAVSAYWMERRQRVFARMGDAAVQTKKTYQSTVVPINDDTDIQRASGIRYLSLHELLCTSRFWFMFGMVSTVPGFGGLALLNTAESLIAARLLDGSSVGVAGGDVTGEEIASGVRAVVLLFSAASVAGRLVIGLFVDAPRGWDLKRSEMSPCRWRYTLIQIITAAMMVGLLLCAYSSSWWVLVAAGVVGSSTGMAYAVFPALVQDFFGVESFPRDFSIMGIGTAATCTSTAWVSLRLTGAGIEKGSWVDVAASEKSDVLTRYCAGTACYRWTYNYCVGMVFVAIIMSLVFRRRVLADL